MHDRIAHHHVSFLEDQDEPTSIIAKKLEELSFSTSMRPKKSYSNIINFIEFKNMIRFKIKGYDYLRISNKFEYKHLRSCTNKIKGLTKRIMTKKVVCLSL